MILVQVIVDRPRPRFNKKGVGSVWYSLTPLQIVVSLQISPSFRKSGAGVNRLGSRDKFGSRVQKKINPDGSYNFRYSTSDGMSRQESGKTSSTGSVVQSGSWSYTGADGKQYQMKFVADQFGYRPQGAHLHVAHQLAFKQQEMLARRARARKQQGSIFSHYRPIQKEGLE